MKRIPRIRPGRRPADGFAPSATTAPARTPSWPGNKTDDWTPLRLAPEDPWLLREYARGALNAAEDRPQCRCRILDASRAEVERQRRTAALADALAFEAAAAEAELILHPHDPTAAAYLELLHAAMPVVSDRATLPLAVTR